MKAPESLRGMNPRKLGITFSFLGFVFGSAFFVEHNGGLGSFVRKIEYGAQERTIERRASLLGITQRQLIRDKCFSKAELDYEKINPLFVTSAQIENCKDFVFKDAFSLLVEGIIAFAWLCMFGIAGAAAAYIIGYGLPIMIHHAFRLAAAWATWVKN